MLEFIYLICPEMQDTLSTNSSATYFDWFFRYLTIENLLQGFRKAGTGSFVPQLHVIATFCWCFLAVPRYARACFKYEVFAGKFVAWLLHDFIVKM